MTREDLALDSARLRNRAQYRNAFGGTSVAGGSTPPPAPPKVTTVAFTAPNGMRVERNMPTDLALRLGLDPGVAGVIDLDMEAF